MSTMQWLAVAMLAALGVTDIYASGRLFLCERDGKSVFTDRTEAFGNCRALSVSRSNVADGAPAASMENTQDMKCASANASSIAEELARIKQRCERMRAEIAELEARLRSGYTAQQGKQINQRLDELGARLKAEHCH